MPPPPPGAYQPPPPGYGYPARSAPTDQMAIWSAVIAGLGVLGLCCAGVGGLILGGVAFFLGNSSLRRIRDSGGALGGDSVAQAGRIVGLVVAVLGLLILIGYVVVVAAMPRR